MARPLPRSHHSLRAADWRSSARIPLPKDESSASLMLLGVEIIYSGYDFYSMYILDTANVMCYTLSLVRAVSTSVRVEITHSEREMVRQPHMFAL